MAAREELYRDQLKALGTYDTAFEPLIKELCQLERRRTRLQKAWSATAKPGEKPSFLDPHYAILTQLEREIMAMRDTMGLTPKSLRRLKGIQDAAPQQQDLITEKLTAIADRVQQYNVAAKFL